MRCSRKRNDDEDAKEKLYTMCTLVEVSLFLLTPPPPAPLFYTPPPLPTPQQTSLARVWHCHRSCLSFAGCSAWIIVFYCRLLTKFLPCQVDTFKGVGTNVVQD